jgi:hypothetical protein
MPTTGERIWRSPMLRLDAALVVAMVARAVSLQWRMGVAGCTVGRAQARARRRAWNAVAERTGNTGIIRGCKGSSPGRAAVDSVASQAAGARVVPLRRIGVEGPTLTQDAHEASSARVVRPNQQTPVYGHAACL